MRPELEGMIAAGSLGKGISLPGWVEHRELQRHLASSDVFAFPSIREFGGAVILEAMATGLVPIVVAYGGPGELVTEETGFRIPIGPRDRIVTALRNILNDLSNHPEMIDRMGQAARERAFAGYTWEAKARNVVSIYRWVLGWDKSRPRPNPEWEKSLV